MAINIKFDLAGNPEPPTIILANRNGNKLGQLKVNEESVDLSDKFIDASEFSFTLNKYIDEEITPLWDKVVDFKLVYCKEWDTWFEIKVELDEATETVKTVFCTQLEKAELSQLNLYGIHVNEEGDPNWNPENEEYKSTILCDDNNKETSLLHRLLKDKAPHYSVAHVDDTIKNEQRSFSFDGVSIDDAFQEIAEEIGCVFIYHSYIDENKVLRRTISVYDLQQYCRDCRYRGEFTDRCPKCNSNNIEYGYGEDTLIFVTSDELASEGIELVTDTDSVKNCFKLEAGDDLMTATIRNCNPNGSDYIWYFSDSLKEDMSEELVGGLESYDALYEHYYKDYEYNLNEVLLGDYNRLAKKYRQSCISCGYENDEIEFNGECPSCGSKKILVNKDLQEIGEPIKGYPALMNAYYNVIDLALYLESGLMPNVDMSGTSASEQAKLLTTSSLSTVAVADVDVATLSTIDSVVLAMAKTIVKSTYKVEIKSSELSNKENGTKEWKGSFIVTNYSDEDDTADSSVVSINVNDDLEKFIEQKIERALNKENTDNYSISELFKKELETMVVDNVYRFSGDFYDELKRYALNPLKSFREACQSCIEILIEQDVKSDISLYKNIYVPYYNKLKAIESEIKVRESDIILITSRYDADNNLVFEGLQSHIEDCVKETQNELDFKKYLGETLWLEFCAYRRDDKYSNENYISDGLNNAELFKRALEFFEVAENEIYKSSELQHSISTTLNNLLAIDKFKPLVNSFNVGNWIRVRVDDKIFKLRLLEYEIDFGSFENISVKFSDVTKIKNGITDVKSAIEQASSMATSYSSVQRQASQGNKANYTMEQWMTDGLNAALVRILNNENEEIALDEKGLLCRSYDDITGDYSPEQFKITHNIMAYTDNNWETVKQALGKHSYKAFDEGTNQIVDRVGYGISSEFVNSGVISGSQIIGGDIYSNNYQSGINDTYGDGSYLNLADGTFSFAGGRLTYDGEHLSVDGEVTVATNGTIGCWNVDNFSIYKGADNGDNAFGKKNCMYFGTKGLSLGDAFKVTPDGAVTATNFILSLSSDDSDIEIDSNGKLICGGAIMNNAVLNNVIANSGSIGNWRISPYGGRDGGLLHSEDDSGYESHIYAPFSNTSPAFRILKCIKETTDENGVVSRELETIYGVDANGDIKTKGIVGAAGITYAQGGLIIGKENYNDASSYDVLKNFKVGTLTLNSNAETSIEFKSPMGDSVKDIKIALTPITNSTGVYTAKIISKTNNGFTVRLDGDEVTENISFDYIAVGV